MWITKEAAAAPCFATPLLPRLLAMTKMKWIATPCLTASLAMTIKRH
ncbi:hypothetical protein [uncultured Helicobacter sp.]|nr:hypothetical protein [uncultured Helicobacter sp.]